MKRNRVPYENFICIKTKEIAYVLGFLWADGYIRLPYTISSTINQKDSSDIKNIFNKTGDWSFYNYEKYDKRTNKKYKSFTITTSNKMIVNFLIENEYDKKSTVSPSKILSKIPEEFISHFIRGYSDGDGCFYKNDTQYQYSITSTHNQDWSCIENILSKLKITYSIKLSEGKKYKYSQLRITNKNDIDIFGDYIYQNFDNIGLNRKYINYLDIKNIKINKLIYWTDNDLEFLINNYNKLSNSEIGFVLNKTKYSVDAKSSKLKLKNKK